MEAVPAERAPAAVTVVVVSHNSCRDVGRCLESVRGDCERVIVVDNASTDGTVEFLREHDDTAEVLALSENSGYGTAANRGVALAQSPFVLVLNADAWGLPGALARLLSAAERNPKLGLVAPRLLNQDGSSQRSVFGYPATPLALASWIAAPGLVSGVFRGWRATQSLFARRRGLAADVEPIEGQDFPAGAALLVRKEAWDEAEGFDEAFFMYSEETDLCRRLRKLGWRVGLCPAAEFVHVGGASTSEVRDAMRREQLRSYLRYFAKHQGVERAERARRLVSGAVRLRALLLHGDERAGHRALAGWLRGTSIEALLR